MSASEAEAAILAAPTAPIGPSYRYQLAAALRTDGAPVHGVDRRLLADVIDVPPTRAWSTALHPRENGGGEPFSPQIVMNGQRTLLPEDLGVEHEAPLRAVAQASANPFVQGIVFDVLWVRFGLHTDARAAKMHALPRPG
ncbi:MAG: hypothetical protein SFX73_18180 [Kofleriaceae bacterium]|nr:hypothetical protein [Kofleriaceae bacterium]